MTLYTDPTYPTGLYPSVNGTQITIDMLLANNGSIVARAIRDLALENFPWGQVFSPAGKIVGGSQLHEQATINDLYPKDDVERIEPGDSYPRIQFNRLGLLTSQVEKFGGEFVVPDESSIRTRPGYVTRRAMQLSNVIVRKTNMRAMSELDAAITAFSRTVTGTSWLDALALTLTEVAPSLMPVSDLADIQAANEEAELGYIYDFGIFHPSDYALLYKLTGNAEGVRELLAGVGINGFFTTMRQTAGTVKFLQRQMVGEMGYEDAAPGFTVTTGNSPSAPAGTQAPIQIATKVYREEGNDQDVVKAHVKPIVYVTDPFAIVELDGIRA